MFCPKCLSNSVHLKEKGVMNILVNGRQKDTGRFLFNLDRKDEILQNISDKIHEHLQWMASFNNKKPVQTVHVVTTDAKCDNGCAIPLSHKFSLTDHIISTKGLKDLIAKHAKESELELELDI